MRTRFSYLTATVAVLVASVAHSAAPPLPGTISVEPAFVEPELGSSMPVFVEAVGKALADREFTLLAEPGHARFVADLKLIRVDVGTTTAKVSAARPTAVPGGDPSRVGGSLNFSLPTAKTKTVPLQQTRLEIRIRKRGEENVMWHGTAMTVRSPETPEGREAAVASDLSEAIFRTYPVQSENVISVP